MEEVSTHVHPGPIVPDEVHSATSDLVRSRIPVLLPQLHWHVQPNPLAPLDAMWCTLFDLSQLPTRVLFTNRDQLDFMPSNQHQWAQHIRDGLVLPVEDLSSPTNDYIRWYRDIMRVYIDNTARRDIRTIGYPPARLTDG
ncbi:hypothetical protein M9H77_15969 [Catharanthus roseus]|uniref:Uncharacterized protein n=1 Tax=Catharanthus roseus TaxID=4058 RepID=A0ACC0AZD3_CATRO|nr:hypothetical protein M9H77_15969 [Catharanthus roseus]